MTMLDTTKTSPTPIVAIDTETTGLGPQRRAWEIAMIRRDEKGTRERRYFVAVDDITKADEKALQIGGYWDRHPDGRRMYGRQLDGPPQEVLEKRYAAREVMAFTAGAHLVGVNPAFDAATLEPMLRACGYVPVWHYHLIDVAAMAYGVAAAAGLPVELPYRSDDLARLCGVEPPADDDRHTALGDARWALRWYDTLTTPPSANERGIVTVKSLREAAFGAASEQIAAVTS